MNTMNTREQTPKVEGRSPWSSRTKWLAGGVALAASMGVLPGCTHSNGPEAKRDVVVIVGAGCRDAETNKLVPPGQADVSNRRANNRTRGMNHPDITDLLCPPGSVLLSERPGYTTVPLTEYNPDSDLRKGQVAVVIEGVLGDKKDNHIASLKITKNEAGQPHGVILGTNATGDIVRVHTTENELYETGK